MTDAQFKELSDRLWNERVIYSSKGDPVMFRMHFDSAIREAIEQASQRIAQLETYISDNLHKKAICGCGDSIEPDTGAVCGNCASETQSNLERLIEAEQASQPQADKYRQALEFIADNADMRGEALASIAGEALNGN